MHRLLFACVGACAALAGASAVAQPSAKVGPPPWAALTSPSAALKVVVDEVCLPAVIEQKPVEPLALYRRMVRVDPKRAGSNLATGAWRLASLGEVVAMQLPQNSGCSAFVERGEPEQLAAEAVAFAKARLPDLTRGETGSVRNGARTDAYCTSAPQPIVFVVLVKVDPKRTTSLVINTWRAAGVRPPFCAS